MEWKAWHLYYKRGLSIGRTSIEVFTIEISIQKNCRNLVCQGGDTFFILFFIMMDNTKHVQESSSCESMLTFFEHL
jgi:hypothetical protein